MINIPRGGNIRISFYTVLILLCIAILFSINALAYSGGTGTSADPFQIASIDDLYNVRYNYTLNFTMTADLDFDDGGDYEDATNMIENTTGFGWLPICYYGSGYFSGTFNGQNHTISNLYIDRHTGGQSVGLFCSLYNGTVTNLTITNSYILGTTYGGSLAGLIDEASIVSFVRATNVYIITDFGPIGCLIGMVQGGSFVNHSSSSGDAYDNENDDNNVGGLIGSLDESTVSDCHSSANATGEDFIGGLIGYAFYSTISESFATGNPTGRYNIGGFIGQLENTNIINSYSTGEVTGTLYIGGFYGSITGGDIDNCYYIPTITPSFDTDICPCCDEMCIEIYNVEGEQFNISIYTMLTSDDVFTHSLDIVNMTNGTYCFCLCQLSNTMFYNRSYYWYFKIINETGEEINVFPLMFSTTTLEDCPCGDDELIAVIEANDSIGDYTWIVGLIIIMLGFMFYFTRRR